MSTRVEKEPEKAKSGDQAQVNNSVQKYFKE